MAAAYSVGKFGCSSQLVWQVMLWLAAAASNATRHAATPIVRPVERSQHRLQCMPQMKAPSPTFPRSPQWWAEMNGLRVAAIKILENEAEGWTGHKLHKDYPHYFRVVFHLPLVEGCESGLVAAYGKGASARRIWISDQQGRVALGASSYGLSVMHCLFYHAAAVRGHSLSVVVDFHHKDA